MMWKADSRTQIFFLIFFLTLVFLTACQKASDGSASSASPAISGSQANSPVVDPPVVAPPSASNPATPSVPVVQNLVAPLWEASRKSDGPLWTAYSYEMVQTYGASLLAGSNDISQFCPKYSTLSTKLKSNFWVYLISAMAKYESGFDPTNRYVESTMGTDPITGQQVASEGLLQLSYQDVQAYPYCNEFNWQVDRNLSATDPNKTILDPFKNLKCGIRILNQIVGRKKLISFTTGHYWSVLQLTSSAQPKIKALTNALSFCKL